MGVGISVCIMLLAAAFLANQRPIVSCKFEVSKQECLSTAKALLPDIDVSKAPPRNPEPNRQEWREEIDLNAQLQMAEYALIAAIAAIIGVAVTTIGIVFVKQTLDATRAAVNVALKSNETMNQMGRAQVRAYITPSEVQVLLEGRCAVLHFKLHNSGNSPAFKVQVTGSALMSFDSVPKWRDKFSSGAVGAMLGPIRQGTDTQECRLHIGVNFLTDEQVRKLPEIQFLYISAHLRVSYLDVFNDRRIETFDYMALMAKPCDGKTAAMAPNQDFHFDILEDASRGHDPEMLR